MIDQSAETIDYARLFFRLALPGCISREHDNIPDHNLALASSACSCQGVQVNDSPQRLPAYVTRMMFPGAIPLPAVNSTRQQRKQGTRYPL